MSSIMANIPNLAENKRQERGVYQLEPKNINDHQQSNTEAQKGQGRKNLIGIIRWLLIQQPSLSDQPPKLWVIVGL